MSSLLALYSVVQLVREYDCVSDLSPLHVDAMRGQRSVVEALTDAGAPLELNHMMGVIALSLAVENGHGEVALGLLGAGADVNTINDRGFYSFPDYTPLCIVCARNSKYAVDILLAAGAHLGEESGPVLPLHLAAERECLGPLDSLLAAGASVNEVDSDGRSALHMACLHTHPEKIE
ncbi:unnamed protein product, partial [Hapterophycus canaliculatus]